ncbi:MAG: bifunctional pyr operon transcriptional regulator/uracil phosphoribosyltransferase PyrR [Polyangiaceae bacterium]
MRELLDAEGVDRGLRRVAGEILERHRASRDLVLIGIRRGGVPLARKLKALMVQIEGLDVPIGSVDITLYRDDAATALANPRIGPSDVPVSLDAKRVILVDNVVYTGRTIRAAFDALLDYGRTRSIELFALVDRGGRELPIQPDYLVRTVQVERDERVDVIAAPNDGLVVWARPYGSPTMAPPPPASPNEGAQS